MKIFMSLLVSLFAFSSFSEVKMKMYFNNEEIIKIIEMYSKSSGQKFVIDPSVRGKISIFLQDEVTLEEAFNQLSSGLAVNGFAISKQGDTMIVKSARNIQRDLIEVSTERPTLKPERMATWIYTVKHFPAVSMNRDLRILVSKDGELSVNTNTNQMIISDWTSNLNRVAELMKEIDKPLDPAVVKIVEVTKKERDAFHKEKMSKKEDKKGKIEN